MRGSAPAHTTEKALTTAPLDTHHSIHAPTQINEKIIATIILKITILMD